MSQSIPSNRSFGGFWIRAAAAIVDSMLLLGLAVLAVQLLYGQSYFDWALRPSEGMNRSQFFFNWVLPAIYYIGFWIVKSATLAVNAKYRCPLFSNLENSPFECLRFPCVE